MKVADSHFNSIKEKLVELTSECNKIGDKATVQLLLEVEEMLHISHQSLLGNALNSIREHVSEPDE